MNESTLRINDVYLDSGALDYDGRYLVLKGSAGSGKSVFTAQKHVLRALNTPGERFLVVRKVKATVRNSVYHLLGEVARSMNLDRSEWKADKTNLGYIVGDSEILTVGMDDPEKLKSISGITSVWIEEATELTEDDFDQIDLRLRGQSPGYKQIVLSFNPVSKKHWLRSRFFDEGSDVSDAMTLSTTYHDNLCIDDDYKRVLERLRHTNPSYYRVYGLGEWGELEEGLTFKRSILDGVLYDEHQLPHDARGVVYCDPNLSKKGKGDTTGIARLLFSPTTQEYYLDSGRCRSFSNSADLLDAVFDLYGKNARTIGFDGNVSQASTWSEHVANYSRIRKIAVPLVEFKRYSVDELSKNASLLWSEGRIRVSRRFARSEEGEEFLAQMWSFAGKKAGGKKKDDAPDSLICAIELIHERGLAIRKAVADSVRKLL